MNSTTGSAARGWHRTRRWRGLVASVVIVNVLGAAAVIAAPPLAGMASAATGAADEASAPGCTPGPDDSLSGGADDGYDRSGDGWGDDQHRDGYDPERRRRHEHPPPEDDDGRGPVPSTTTPPPTTARPTAPVPTTAKSSPTTAKAPTTSSPPTTAKPAPTTTTTKSPAPPAGPAGSTTTTSPPGVPPLPPLPPKLGSPLLRPFAPASPWNQLIPTGSSYAATTALAGDPGWVNYDECSVPVYVGGAADAMTTIHSPARTITLAVPPGATPTVCDDHNFTLVDTVHHQTVDVWRATRTSATSFEAALVVVTDLGGTGFGTKEASGAVKAGVRSSGASALGGLVTGQDIALGHIDHALAIALSADELATTFVAPATGTDATASVNTGSIPMGSRLGIRPSTAKPAGLSPVGSMIWDALVHYGGYVVDRTSDGLALVAEARTMNASAIAPLRTWWTGPPSDLEQIVPVLTIVRA